MLQGDKRGENISKITENVVLSKKSVASATIYKGFTHKTVIGKVHIVNGLILHISTKICFYTNLYLQFAT